MKFVDQFSFQQPVQFCEFDIYPNALRNFKHNYCNMLQKSNTNLLLHFKFHFFLYKSNNRVYSGTV